MGGKCYILSGKSASKAKKKKKTPSTLRRNARRRAEFVKNKLEASTSDALQSEEAVEKVVVEKAFKCDQCESSFKSENGLKIHAGRSHKKVVSLSTTPERLRQQLKGSVSLSARRSASTVMPWKRRQSHHHLFDPSLHLLHLTNALPSTHVVGESAS